MTREIETLKITWKYIRKSGYKHTRTPKTYCVYLAENERNKHRLRTYEDSKLFKLLATTTISKNPKYTNSVFVDGVYCDGKLVSVTNPRKL